MTFRIAFTPKALKQIDRLEKVMVQRVRRFFERLDRTNPRAVGKPLAGNIGLWRYRIGDYRVLASIEDGELLVLIVEVAHRRDVYRDI